MVRLKHTWFQNKGNFAGCLNSTMVRLKRKYDSQTVYSKIGLNSTMVRLKNIIYINKKIIYKTSQFHYGSIKTIP